jgi:hypothetical protein
VSGQLHDPAALRHWLWEWVDPRGGADPVAKKKQHDSLPSPWPIHNIKIHFNIILPYTLRSPKWPLPFRSSDQFFVCVSPLSKRATCPAHLILLVLMTLTKYGEPYKSRSSSLCSVLQPPHPQFSVLSHSQSMGLHYNVYPTAFQTCTAQRYSAWLRDGWLRVRVPAGAGNFSLHRPDRQWVTPSLLSSKYQELFAWR